MKKPIRQSMNLILGIAAFLFAAAAAADSYAIVNVNVLSMDREAVSSNKTVLISNGRIASIAAVDSVAVPDGATVIDGTDRYLMPGLVEMHAHVTATNERDVTRLFNLFLANGVTTIRGMLGRPSHLTLRDRIAAGDVMGPRLVTSGPSLNGNSVRGAADATRQVREQHAAGYDFLKIHPGLTAAEFDAIADAANELGIPFAGHVPVSVGLSGALQKGMATIDHLDGYMAAMLPRQQDANGGYGGFFGVMLADDVDASRLPELVAATAEARVANVPTQTLFEQLVSSVPAETLGGRAENRYVAPSTVASWVRRKQETVTENGFRAATAERAIELRRRLIAELHDAGAVLLLGSDAPQIFNVPGFAIHHELQLMVAAGLSPYEALATGTVAPADFLDLDNGRVAEGRIADLVLLDANPLEDIRNSRRVYGVFAAGRWSRAGDLLAAIQ